jgi:hypothetical protein
VELKKSAHGKSIKSCGVRDLEFDDFLGFWFTGFHLGPPYQKALEGNRKGGFFRAPFAFRGPQPRRYRMAKRRRKAKKAKGKKTCIVTRKHRVVCGTLTSKPRRKRRKSRRK